MPLSKEVVLRVIVKDNPTGVKRIRLAVSRDDSDDYTYFDIADDTLMNLGAITQAVRGHYALPGLVVTIPDFIRRQLTGKGMNNG